MNKNIFVIGNLIWIRIYSDEIYGSKTVQYVCSVRTGSVLLNAVLTADELDMEYPSGKWFEYINPSDTVIFNNI